MTGTEGVCGEIVFQGCKCSKHGRRRRSLSRL